MRLLLLAACASCAVLSGSLGGPRRLVDCAPDTAIRAAWADSGQRIERRLQAGRAAFRDQDYEQAIRTLQRVADDDRATTTQRAQALELIALAHLILGEVDKGEEVFLELVVLAPGYELSSDFGSDDIRATFERVKGDFLEHNAPAKLAHQAPARARANARVELEVRVEAGADMVKSAVVRWRRQGERDYREADMTPAGDQRWRARVALPTSKTDYAVEYYFEGRDLSGLPCTRLGGPLAPRSLDVGAAIGEKRWYRRWYVIAGGAAVASIAAVMIIAAATN